MRWRIGVILIGWSLAVEAVAGPILPKNLVVSIGGGGGLLAIGSNSGPFAAHALWSSAVRFSFGYALGEHFSIGGHYARIGSVVHPVLDRVRFTNYLVEGTYRIHNGEAGVLETAIGFGPQIGTLRPANVSLPYDLRGLAINGGVRYLHSITAGLGLSVAFDHIQAFTSDVTFAGDPLLTGNGDRSFVFWNSTRITASMFFKF